MKIVVTNTIIILKMERSKKNREWRRRLEGERHGLVGRQAKLLSERN